MRSIRSLRWDREREGAVFLGRGAVVYTWLTKSVSLGVRGVWKDGNCWQHLCARVCASTRQDSTFDKHGEITMRRCQRVLSLAGRGRLEVSTTCDFLRWAENAWLRLISICTHTCLKMTHACARTHTHARTHSCYCTNQAPWSLHIRRCLQWGWSINKANVH